MSNKKHWETVYETKTPNEVSWTQEVPRTSLEFITNLNLPKTAEIIDIGGGDSYLVDHLIELGFENISVLDISKQALERAKIRLGEKASKITWIESDITEFIPDKTYDLWHDRATFHFLTAQNDVNYYQKITREFVKGYLIVGTFSTNGPKKCSGLEICQYDENSLDTIFSADFVKQNCIIEDHTTPFDTTQNFIFCLFRKK